LPDAGAKVIWRSKIQKSLEQYKIVIMAVLLVTTCLLTYYCHVVLKTGIVFTHLYYIPIVLASIWWKRKGLAVPVFLTGFLILSHNFFRLDSSKVDDSLRASMFIVVGAVVAVLSKRIAKAGNSLLAHQQKLRLLASRLSLVEEHQRHRIASDLHDSVGQKLSAAKILAQTLKKKEIMGASEHLDKIIDWTESSIREVRDLTFKLSPKVLYELGLKAAVESLIEQFEEDSSLKFHYTYGGPTNILNQNIRLTIFRAIRELFANICKHANGQNVSIDIRIENNILRVTVEDDGIGFHASRVLNGTETADGFGLFSIQQQLLDIDGHVSVDSHAGKGTKITLTCPVGPREKASAEKELTACR